MKLLPIITVLSMAASLLPATSAIAELTTANGKAVTIGMETAGKSLENSTHVKSAEIKPELIDLNNASIEQLTTLPGIGKKEADKIIAGRPYTMKAQLVIREIIPDATYNLILKEIVVGQNVLVPKTTKSPEITSPNSVQKKIKKFKQVKVRSGLIYQDMVKGSGKSAVVGNWVNVHYTGWLENGTKFDSSYDRSEPFSFVLGKGEVIRGWDEGIRGMKTGSKRKLIIPAKLGYGQKGAGNNIPPNATLIFEVEVLAVQ